MGNDQLENNITCIDEWRMLVNGEHKMVNSEEGNTISTDGQWEMTDNGKWQTMEG